jgi:hypothetical protein
MPLPTLLVVIVFGTGELASLELGSPLEPDLLPSARVELILADYELRRDLLREMDPPDASEALAARLQRGALRPTDLLHLIQALGTVGMPQGSDAVEKHIGDPNPAIRLAVIRSLGQMGKFSNIALIRPYLQDADPEFRRTAVIALGKFAKPEVIPELESAASRDPKLIPLVQDAKRRIDAMTKEDYGAFVDAVIGTNEWEDIYSLFMMAWHPLVDRLSDKQQSLAVRMRAVQMIGWGHMRRASQALTAIVADPLEPPELRLQAIVALGRCRIRSSVGQLIPFLNAPEQSVQLAAITSLGQLAVSAAIEPLVKKWNDRGGIYRETIRLALRRSCSLSGTEALTDLLMKDAALTDAKIYFVDPSLNLFDSLRPGLLDPWLLVPSSPARRDAALLLAFFGRRKDAAKLDPLRSDPDPLIRDLAERAAKRLAAPGAP